MSRPVRIVAFAVVFVLAAAVSSTALAGNGKGSKAEKVDICHATHSWDAGVATIYFGQAISVSGNALPAHLAHGDSEVYFLLADPGPGGFATWRAALAALFGVEEKDIPGEAFFVVNN